MIETVLDEVLAAEREAARLKAEAEAEARDIGLKSHAQAEQAKAEKDAAIRAQVKEILAVAEREAEAESQSVVPARGVAHIGHECDGSRSEPEPRLFARDEHLAGLTRDEAVGHRVVIGPELQRKSLPEIDHDPVAAIFHLPLFINRCVVYRVDPVPPHAGHPAPLAPAFAGNEPHSQGRRLQNLTRIRSDGIYDSITASDRDGQRTIG